MIDDFVYLISSHQSYGPPRHSLLKNMGEIGVDFGRIILAVGGSSVITHSAGSNYMGVAHNSFDFTALIAVLDSGIKLPSHIFTMHDTMEIGPNTDQLLRNVDPNVKATGVFGWMSNLIMVRTDWLYECREQVLAMRNCSKLPAVENEGMLWKLAGDSGANYPDAGFPETTHGHCPYGGAQRIREYYANVEITKWKANWGQSFTEWETRP